MDELGLRTQQKAFESFYENHYRPGYRFLRSRIGEDQIPDILSQSFEIAWKRFSEYLQSPTGYWFYSILRNQLRIQRKKYKPIHESFNEQIHILRETTNPETIALRKETTSHLERAIAALSTPYAEAVRLRLKGYKYEQIAAILNLSEAATKSRMRRAIVHLVAAFETYLQER
jgi:RNA polymerase sigma factor (sigma-70 family)